MGAKGISVFYHLFAVAGWRSIWAEHIGRLRESGLYEACDGIRVSVVYEDEGELSQVAETLSTYGKVSLFRHRALSTPPVIWANPRVQLPDGRLGECETILQMAHYAQQQGEAFNCLFLHTKGITNPPLTKRKNFAYFVQKGLDANASDAQANAFALKELNTVIVDWQDHVSALESASFSYAHSNFFWITGSLLRQFDFDDYLAKHAKQAPPQQRRHVLGRDWNGTRHIFALFPIKLHAFVNGITLQRPPYEYVDVRR